MTRENSTNPIVVGVVLFAAVLLLGTVLLVAAAGYFWLRVSRVEAIEQKQRAEQQRMEAKVQSQLAEERLLKGDPILEDAMDQAERNQRRLETVQQRARVVQEQFDEAFRTWREIIEESDGMLTGQEVADMEEEFDKLQVRLRELDENFQ